MIGRAWVCQGSSCSCYKKRREKQIREYTSSCLEVAELQFQWRTSISCETQGLLRGE